MKLYYLTLDCLVLLDRESSKNYAEIVVVPYEVTEEGTRIKLPPQARRKQIQKKELNKVNVLPDTKRSVSSIDLFAYATEEQLETVKKEILDKAKESLSERLALLNLLTQCINDLVID